MLTTLASFLVSLIAVLTLILVSGLVNRCQELGCGVSIIIAIIINFWLIVISAIINYVIREVREIFSSKTIQQIPKPSSDL